MEFYFVVDLYGCVRLLTEVCLTLTILYPSKIPLRLIWSICSAFFYFALLFTVQRGFQEAAKNVYICFVDNSLLFPREKEFSKSANRW